MSAQIIVPARFRHAVEMELHAAIEHAHGALSTMLDPLAPEAMNEHYAQAHWAASRCDIVEVNRLLYAARMCVAVAVLNTVERSTIDDPDMLQLFCG